MKTSARIEKRWDHYRKQGKVKPCYLCGDKHILLTRSCYPNRFKRWGLECRYCHCATRSFFTIRGAIRYWNQKTNVVRVRDGYGE